MKKNRFILYLASVMLLLSACKKDSTPDVDTPEPQGPEDGIFVLAATRGLVGADLLYTSNALDNGVLETTGKGLEQEGSNHNYMVANNTFFSMRFGAGSPGAVTAYRVSAEKKLEKVSTFQTESMTAFGVIGDDILMIKNAWQPSEEFAKWYRLNTKTLQIEAQGEINANKLAGNGGKAFFTDLKQVGNKLFAPYWNIESGLNFRTQYPDSTMIAVYSYPDMKLEKVIRDARTGSIGAYFTSGMEVDEQGDVYVFGTKLGWDKTGKYSTNTPVAVMKIKNGTTEYDKSYFFNVTQASDGKYILKKLYLGKGKFLLTMGDRADVYATTMGLTNPISFAIADVYAATFKWVTGAPDPTSIYRTTEYSYNYSPRDGKTGYLGINVVNMQTFEIAGKVYKFDAETATATIGLTLDAQAGFTSINWVPVTK